MRAVWRSVVVLAGLLAMHSTTSPGQQLAPLPYETDPRLAKLRSFFEELGSPAYALAEDFLVAADRHGLDWRLLPSISIVESGGGKAFRNNNILGWDSCQSGFPTVRAGIHFVASRLAISELYRDKNLDEKLALYNPNPQYPPQVKSLMAHLNSGQDLSSPHRTESVLRSPAAP